MQSQTQQYRQCLPPTTASPAVAASACHAGVLALLLAGMFAFAYRLCSGDQIPRLDVFITLSGGFLFVLLACAASEFGWRGVRWYGSIFVSLWSCLLFTPQLQIALRANEITPGMPIPTVFATMHGFGGREDMQSGALQFWATPDQYAAYGSTYVRVETNGAVVVNVRLAHYGTPPVR